MTSATGLGRGPMLRKGLPDSCTIAKALKLRCTRVGVGGKRKKRNRSSRSRSMKWRQYASAYFGLCQIRGKGFGWVDFHGMTRKCFKHIGETSNLLIPNWRGVVSLESGAEDWGIRGTFKPGTGQWEPHIKNTRYYVPLMLPLPWRLRSPLSPTGFARDVWVYRRLDALSRTWVLNAPSRLTLATPCSPSSSHFGSHRTAGP